MVSFKLLFPLVLLVFLLRSPSVSGGNTFQLMKVRVYVFNMINYFDTFHPNMTIHCRSVKDDLPAIQIPFLRHDFIHFKVNIFASTYFLCDLWYVDEQRNNKMLTDIYLYNFKKHSQLCDHNNCYWIATEYGLFLKTGEFVQPQFVVPWGGSEPEVLKKYDPKTKIPFQFLPSWGGKPKPESPGGLEPPNRGRGGRGGGPPRRGRGGGRHG